MGKPTGFLEYERHSNHSVPPKDRVKNFDEFHPPLNDEERKKQGARCMNCGVPFCQSGMKLDGFVTGCPLHNLIPEWNDEIYNGNMHEAYLRLIKTNNFPEFTGRVCPALCEAACTCAMNGYAVTVRENELYTIENAFANGFVKPKKKGVPSGKKIAVIGAGPAGLAAADTLNMRGHSVTVFEREKKIGGLLMYGIPNMKLDKSVIARREDIMRKEGVEFKTGVDVGKDVNAKEILKEFDAVIIACGSKTARDIKAEGRDAKGIYFAVDYLSDATRFVTGETDKLGIDAKGKNVVIVGGGDTGNDCVGTAIRQGCKSVVQLEMMEKLPDARPVGNEWPRWPKVCKTDYGQEEALAVFGNDPRIYKTTVKEFIKDEKGALKAVKTVLLEKKEDEKTGRFVMSEVKDSEKILPCELLLIAAGFVGAEDYVTKAFDVKKGERGNIDANDEEYKADGKIFAAGDCRRGQSLVVWAISEGRECAKAVDKYLIEIENM